MIVGQYSELVLQFLVFEQVHITTVAFIYEVAKPLMLRWLPSTHGEGTSTCDLMLDTVF